MCHLLKNDASVLVSCASAKISMEAVWPISVSKMCCLGFADYFLQSFMEHSGNSLQPSALDLERIIKKSIKLSERVAEVYEDTIQPSLPTPRDFSNEITFLVSKFHGLFGNRLECIGKDVRVLIHQQLCNEETLLLGMLHRFSASLSSSDERKWSLVFSAGSLCVLVCGQVSADTLGFTYFLFDPQPRPELGAIGPSYTQFSTLRGLQLHLLSIFSKSNNLDMEGHGSSEYITISLVAQRLAQDSKFNQRVQLRNSLALQISDIRKSEKVMTIRMKRKDNEFFQRNIPLLPVSKEISNSVLSLERPLGIAPISASPMIEFTKQLENKYSRIEQLNNADNFMPSTFFVGQKPENCKHSDKICSDDLNSELDKTGSTKIKYLPSIPKQDLCLEGEDLKSLYQKNELVNEMKVPQLILSSSKSTIENPKHQFLLKEDKIHNDGRVTETQNSSLSLPTETCKTNREKFVHEEITNIENETFACHSVDTQNITVRAPPFMSSDCFHSDADELNSELADPSIRLPDNIIMLENSMDVHLQKQSNTIDSRQDLSGEGFCLEKNAVYEKGTEKFEFDLNPEISNIDSLLLEPMDEDLDAYSRRAYLALRNHVLVQWNFSHHIHKPHTVSNEFLCGRSSNIDAKLETGPGKENIASYISTAITAKNNSCKEASLIIEDNGKAYLELSKSKLSGVTAESAERTGLVKLFENNKAIFSELPALSKCLKQCYNDENEHAGCFDPKQKFSTAVSENNNSDINCTKIWSSNEPPEQNITESYEMESITKIEDKSTNDIRPTSSASQKQLVINGKFQHVRKEIEMKLHDLEQYNAARRKEIGLEVLQMLRAGKLKSNESNLANIIRKNSFRMDHNEMICHFTTFENRDVDRNLRTGSPLVSQNLFNTNENFFTGNANRFGWSDAHTKKNEITDSTPQYKLLSTANRATEPEYLPDINQSTKKLGSICCIGNHNENLLTDSKSSFYSSHKLSEDKPNITHGFLPKLNEPKNVDNPGRSSKHSSRIDIPIYPLNRKLIRNAIMYLCLAGGHLEDQKLRCLQVLDMHPAKSFVVLLAQNKGLSFKGLYAFCPEKGSSEKIFGIGPVQLLLENIERFYKYNSAGKEFREVHNKNFSSTTDAVSMDTQKLHRKSILSTRQSTDS